VFCVVLFFYLHIQFHLKTGEDLEIYEIDQTSKDKMEEICDLRQPVLFDCDDESHKINSKKYLLDNYPIFEIKIRESKLSGLDTDSELYVPLQLHVANKLFTEDKNAAYFSENNSDFLVETGAVKNMLYNDEFLRPHLVSNCIYDVLFGSANVETPFRYEINYRNYFMVTQGSIKIKLSPPKSSRYLYPVNDYENLEFRSPICPWSPQTKYKADFSKIKCLDIALTPGRFLFIPAYWWYSFKFAANTSVSCFKYRTYMNNIAICPNLFMYALQNQNVERKLVKKFDIKHLTRELLTGEPLTENSLSNGINISEKDLKTETETTNFEDINIREKDLKTELETNIVSGNDLKEETTNISDIPAILMEPSI
jgi:hypothetical protein